MSLNNGRTTATPDFLYEVKGGDRLFYSIFVVSTGLFLCAGFYMKTIKPLPAAPNEKRIERIRTQFMMAERPKEKRHEPKPVPVPEKPKDLTKPVLLKQKDDDIIPTPSSTPDDSRRVYGLRKVYSVGLGAGGSASEAVIGKLGNTINKEIDTLSATPKDLTARPVSVTTITAMPVLRTSIKPEYTETMRKNGVEGTIAAKILVGSDGKVKDVILMNDLGFDSRDSALEAFRKLLFKPALQGEQPAAVWIVMKFKYVLQES